ncbi:PREDICTED: uncharacterized protein LOC104815074 [Tarenaya hassleriana]|uniref:uncharacterized protein LOC104815074 n=1 Tax=Tarenaya hassleriana TaxID=28532 RepID=UPI00053C6FF7|nr:PREDICTED: uncharacterized protein LOC104815074 [Tarenaya hassleriana]
MVGSLSHWFEGLQRMSKNEGGAKPVYRDDLNKKANRTEDSPITNKPLREKEGLKPIRRNTATKKKTHKVVRFADEHTTIKPLPEEEGLEPRKVVNFHVETLRHQKEGLVVEEEEEEKKEVIRVKIKMKKLEAERLLSKRNQNGGVLEFRHVADQIATLPVHHVHVATVLVACNKNDNGGVGAGSDYNKYFK